MKNIKLLVILIVGFVLILPSLKPLLKEDFFQMHDYSHVARLVELDLALKDGHFPARWSKDLGWGYGMPLFQFYAPLPYYLSEGFHLIGFSFLNAIKVCFGLTFFVSFLGMYLLAGKFWGKWGGFLAGVVFVYSPYRAVDFYVRGALGELFAISLIPWILWAITEIFDKRTHKTVIKGSILLALFLLSHTVLNLICVPLFILFGLFYLLINKGIKNAILPMVSSFALGIGLAGFFLFPAFFEKQFSQVEKLTSGFSHYAHHFLYLRQFFRGPWGYGGSVGGIEDGLSFHLGKAHLFLALITVIVSLFFFVFKKREKSHLLVGFFTAVTLVLVFLSTYHSKVIWDAIPLMAFIQFPWRFNSLLIVILGFLSGGTVYYLKKIIGKSSVIFLIIAILIILKVNIKYFQPEKYVDPSILYYTDRELISFSMSGVIPDYLPIWVEDIPNKVARGEFQIIRGDPKIKVIDPEIKVIDSKTHKLVLEIVSPESSKILLNRNYFPGWRLTLNGKESNFEYQKSNGLIKVNLSPGNYDLQLFFEKTLIRIISEIVTLTSLLIIVILLFIKRK